MNRERLVSNIWGRQGCELPDGNKCDACCIVQSIEGPDPQAPKFHLRKSQGVPCKFLQQGKGCSEYENRPPCCREFYCSHVPIEVQKALIANALDRGKVTVEEAEQAYQLAQERHQFFESVRAW